MSTLLEVPGTSPSSPDRHHLRQRSPKGQRGRPRKTRVPKGTVPPPSPLRTFRDSPWFVPVAGALFVTVVALIISAIRISAHSSDYSRPVVVRPASPPSPPRRSAPSPSPSVSVPSAPNPSASPKPGVEDELRVAMDDAVRHALEEAWQLPEHRQDGSAGGGAEGSADGDSEPRQRTLAELYADLEELGISPHELSEVLDAAYSESGERH